MKQFLSRNRRSLSALVFFIVLILVSLGLLDIIVRPLQLMIFTLVFF